VNDNQKVAKGIFERGMWPLVAAAGVVGFFGYQYRRNLINTDSTRRADRKSMEQIERESKSDKDLEQRLRKEVDKERDKKDELYYSRGTLEKAAYEAQSDLDNKKQSEIRK
jgi:hypothetical protein